MSDFPLAQYSEADVKRAGKIIASNLAWTEDTEPRIREAFKIANNWRDAHGYPMRSIRQHLIRYMQDNQIEGLSAARLKRMPAIRGKLQRLGYKLHQIQDLGGCRFIIPDIAGVRVLTRHLRDDVRHDVEDVDDYIARPKQSGYRSHHTILAFKADGAEASIYDGKFIEVQVRTRLQHAWATAVEAVGLFRGETLKNQVGDERWLRLFALISGEFALVEGCEPASGLPDRAVRLREIHELERVLGAVSVLESINLGVRGTDLPMTAGVRPSHYLIRYNHIAKKVDVEPYTKLRFAAQSYGEAEEPTNMGGLETETIVLVEVDKVESLKLAYPNYFGDVEFFTRQLRSLARGRAAEEYAVAPQETLRRLPGRAGDWSWLRANRFPRPGMGGRNRSG